MPDRLFPWSVGKAVDITDVTFLFLFLSYPEVFKGTPVSELRNNSC